MKKIFYIAVVAGFTMFAASCSKDTTLTGGEGELHLGVNIAATSRAAMTEDQLRNTASVKIYNGDFTGMVRQYVYGSMPETLYLPENSYRVDIVAGRAVTDSLPSWEQKSYKGKENFEIVAGKATSVHVDAKICNAISRVSFNESVDTSFQSGYTLKIGTVSEDLDVNAATYLTYNKEKSGTDGFFIVSGFEPSLFWKFEGALLGGESFSKSGEIKAVEAGKIYKLALNYTEKSGELVFALEVDKATDNYTEYIPFDPVSTGLSATDKFEIWAGHTTLYADVDEGEYSDPSAIKFEYAEKDSEVWTSIDAVRREEGVYFANLTNLTPATTYKYRLVIAGEVVGDPREITTEASKSLPNWDLEVTSNADSKNWTSFYDPASSNPELQTKWWDNGSSASAGMLGANYAICYSDTDVPAGIGSTKSARLQSLAAAGKLAAGNLFCGEFAGLDGLNGKVNFGRPWNGYRPTGVRFWYKYKGGKVTNTDSSVPLTTNDYDRFQVKFALGTWDYKKFGGTKVCPVQVNTSKPATFWHFGEIEGSIAYTDMIEIGDGNTSEWKQVTLKFDYSNTKAYPTYIIISAAASQYGDYFVGSSSSALWLDNIELLYE